MTESPEPPATTGSGEVAALRVAARALLESRAFADAAGAILAACKTIVGADAGLVGVCAPGGKGLDVVHLDPGTLELGGAAGLPAPLRRLSNRACKSGTTIVANDLAKGAAPPPALAVAPAWKTPCSYRSSSPVTRQGFSS